MNLNFAMRFTNQNLIPCEKVIILNLMHLIEKGGTGKVKISIADLSKIVGVSGRTVQRLCKGLKVRGFLRVTQSRDDNNKLTANVYEVVGLERVFDE